MEKGLIDSKSPEEFDYRLLEAQPKCDSLECDRTEPKLSKYFTSCVANKMREGMISSIRKAAGMGGDLYFNNASESLDFHYKLQIDQNCINDTLSGKPILKSTMSQASNEYVEMCEQPETLRELLLTKGHTNCTRVSRLKEDERRMA